MRLNKEKYIYIVENFKVFRSYAAFRRAFCKEFKIKTAPKSTTVKILLDKFKLTGMVEDLPRTGHSKTTTSVE